MSEATGRCGCGLWAWARNNGEWLYAKGSTEQSARPPGRYCHHCGHQLLSEGRTLAPATEEERRDADAMALHAAHPNWIVFHSGLHERWVVVNVTPEGVYGDYIGEGETPTEAILAAHPQEGDHADAQWN
jgi:hypothetical protein